MTHSDHATGGPHHGRATDRQPDERVVAVLVYDGFKLLDLAGPVDVFAEANRHGARYRIVLVSATGASVTSSVGVRVAVDSGPDLPTEPDTVLIVGGDVYPGITVPPALTAAAGILALGARRVASICTGAFILASTGLLDGRRSTTHWKVAQTLADRYPATQVEPDSLFVRDGHIYTSAGVSSGIDLALALLEEDAGADMTRLVARFLVVYLQRSGGQSQFSAPLAGPPPATPALRTVVDAVLADPAARHSSADLAAALHLSPRHLSRLFRDELSTTPARFVESVRFDIAKSLLDQGFTATEAAQRAGFPGYESLRRVFAREIGITPTSYQRHFRASPSSSP